MPHRRSVDHDADSDAGAHRDVRARADGLCATRFGLLLDWGWLGLGLGLGVGGGLDEVVREGVGVGLGVRVG